MATSVTLPALGESVTEGTVTRWLKQPGDTVAVDEPLLEVSTDKVDTEIPSPVAGTLLEIKAAEDETVEVGAELCTIGDEGESAGSDSGGGSAEESSDSDSGGGSAEESSDSDSGGGSAEESPGSAPGGASAEESAGPSGAGYGDQGQETAPAAADTKPEAEASGAGTTGGADDSGGSGTPVTLPALGESVTEGTVTRWLKEVGDEVAVDEPLLEVSTDKVDTEIPSPVAGTLLEIKAGEDETVAVGAELAVIGDSGAASGAAEASGGGDAAAPAGEVASPDDDDSSKTPLEKSAALDAPHGDGDAVQAGAPDEGAGEDSDAIPAAQLVQPDAGAESAPQESGGDAAPAATPAATPAPQPAPQPVPQPEASAQEAPSSGPQPSAQEAPEATSSSGDGAGYVTPLVRKMASEQGVDLSSIQGTGVGGRIRKQDVLDAAKAQKAASDQAASAPAPAGGSAEAAAPSAQPSAPSSAPSPLRGRTEPLSRLRKVIAKRMVESLQVSAQLTTVVEVDITSIARLRDSVKEDFAGREGVKLSFMPFFAKAAVDALKAHPTLNASIDSEKGEVTYFDHENLAIAVDTEKGLLTPVIKDAGDLSIAGLARKIVDIAARTRSNKIGPDELAGGTFTLTNTGSRGALFDTPILNQPQVAILGTGTVVKRPVVIDDPNLGETIAVRRMMYLALTYDHRLVDGADAARFLTDVKARLEAAQFEV
jgi:2-oxoglutarate dehydrogenase E2 component (dihydrolipoamide succinyltransferase)